MSLFQHLVSSETGLYLSNYGGIDEKNNIGNVSYSAFLYGGFCCRCGG
jgi:hypothetical protein